MLITVGVVTEDALTLARISGISYADAVNGVTTATAITSIFADKSFYSDMAKTMQDAVSNTFVKKGK